MEAIRNYFRLQKPLDYKGYMKTVHIKYKLFQIFGLYILGLWCIYYLEGELLRPAATPYLVFLSCENTFSLTLHLFVVVVGLLLARRVEIIAILELFNLSFGILLYLIGCMTFTDRSIIICENPLKKCGTIPISFLKSIPLVIYLLQLLAIYISYTELKNFDKHPRLKSNKDPQLHIQKKTNRGGEDIPMTIIKNYFPINEDANYSNINLDMDDVHINHEVEEFPINIFESERSINQDVEKGQIIQNVDEHLINQEGEEHSVNQEDRERLIIQEEKEQPINHEDKECPINQEDKEHPINQEDKECSINREKEYPIIIQENKDINEDTDRQL